MPHLAPLTRLSAQASRPTTQDEKRKRGPSADAAPSHRLVSSSRCSGRRADGNLMRKSLYDRVQEELRKNNRSLFLQRVFVLGKYNHSENDFPDVADGQEDEDSESDETNGGGVECESAASSLLDVDSIVEAPQDEAPDEATSAEKSVPAEKGGETVEAVAGESEVFETPTTPTTSLSDSNESSTASDWDILGKSSGLKRGDDPAGLEPIETLESINVPLDDASIQSARTSNQEEDEAVASEESLPYLPPSPTPLQIALEKAARDCNQASFSGHEIAVFLLTMDKYCLLLVEGSEDMVGDYLRRTTVILDEFWSIDRVLAVNDNIPQCFFKGFVNRFAPLINSGEKYPPSVANDVKLMGQQHRQLVQKARGLCERLGGYLENKNAKPHRDEILPAAEYNKLLPEMQCMELVFNSKRFYRPLTKYARIYDKLPAVDDDSQIWPIPYNYTPLHVFERMPHDINLTFAEYIDRVAKKYEPLYVDDGDDDDGEEGATEDPNAPPDEPVAPVEALHPPQIGR